MSKEAAQAQPSAAPKVDSIFDVKGVELPPDTPPDVPLDVSGEPVVEIYFLIEDDPFEEAAANAWLRKHHPKLYGNKVKNLPLNQLRQQSKIYFLARKGSYGEPPAPAQPVIGRDDQNRLMHENVPPDKLAEQMQPYGPIEVSKYWTRKDSRFSLGGALDMDALHQGITDFVRPCRLHWVDATDLPKGAKPTTVRVTR